MTRWLWILGMTLCCVTALVAAEEGETKPVSNPVVVITTSMGQIEIELEAKLAPLTVANFLQYVDDKHYDGLIFHRVIKGFMIQGGGFDPQMVQKTTRETIKNEAANGLKNKAGTIAMARTPAVDSASSQFFINTVDNVALDFKSPDPRGFGYCVFGHVLKGIDVVQAIEAVAVTQRGQHGNVPAENVVIQSVRRK